jgi:hypothetical protein
VLLGILIDSFRFFDRRWLQIIIAVLICAGITETIVLSTDHFIKIPLITLKDANNDAVSIGYGETVEQILLTLFKVWFDGFMVLLLKNEIDKKSIKTVGIVLDSFKIYPERI